jgi:hypothetical protein
MDNMGKDTAVVREHSNEEITFSIEYLDNGECAYQRGDFYLDAEVEEDGEKIVITGVLTYKYPTPSLPVALLVEIGINEIEPEIIIPGIWYRGNRSTGTGAPSINIGTKWMFREDRISTPGMIISGTDETFYLYNLNLPKVDDSNRCIEKKGKIFTSKIDDTDIGAVGFSIQPAATSVSYRTPYAEYPAPYKKKNSYNNKDGLIPEYSFRRLEGDLSIAVKLVFFRSEANALNVELDQFNRTAFNLYSPKENPQELTISKMKAIMANYFDLCYFISGSVSGFAGIEMLTFSQTLSTYQLEVGFVGRNLLNAAFCLQYGRELANEKYIRMGISVIDTMVNNGLHNSCFLEGYNREESSWSSSSRFFLRRQSEGALALLYAVRNEANPPAAWEYTFVTVAKYICSLQYDDGHLPFSFDSIGGVIDSRGYTTAIAIPLLLEIDVEKAIAAGNYVIEKSINTMLYSSMSLDSACEDKESGIITLSSMLSLYSKTNDSKWLNAAKKAADYVISWYYLWNVPFPPGTLLHNIKFHTLGWGNVSVENNHIDCYLFDLNRSLRILANELDDDYYSRVGSFFYNSIVERLLQYEGHDVGIAFEGLIPEVIQQTNWDYGKGGKGTYNYINAFGWTFSSIWSALLGADPFFKEGGK